MPFQRLQQALVFGTVLLTSAIMACSGDVATNSSASSGSGSSSTSSSSGGAVNCSVDTICLDVKVLEGPVSAGRVAVVWFQLNDDGPDPMPLIAYDAPFDPAATRVEIPLASITIPNEENLLCPRACADEAMCPCTGDPKLGTGFVLVGKDADGNGKLDFAELNSPTEGPSGAGYLGLGYSAMPYTMVPAPYNGLFPEGMDQGVQVYRIIEGNMTFDSLGKSKEGDVFELNVCGGLPGTNCDWPFPNLT